MRSHSASVSNPGVKSTLLIAVTGYGQEEDRRRSLQAGFDYHMIKPVNLAELEKTLTELRTTNKTVQLTVD